MDDAATLDAATPEVGMTGHGAYTALVLAGITHPVADQLAKDVTERVPPERHHERIEHAIAFHKAGAPDDALVALTITAEHDAAYHLITRGLDGQLLADLYETEWLNSVNTALDKDISHDTLARVCAHSTLDVDDILELVDHEIPDTLLELVLDTDHDITANNLTDLLDAGGTWAAIDTILRAGTRHPHLALSSYTTTLRAGMHDYRSIPEPVRMLTAILSGNITSHPLQPLTHPLDLLPAAAAISGQPWEDTALTLLTDASREAQPTWSQAIDAARALEHDTAGDRSGTANDIVIEIVNTYSGELSNFATLPIALYAHAVADQPWADAARARPAGDGDQARGIGRPDDPRLTLAKQTTAARNTHDASLARSAGISERTVSVPARTAGGIDAGTPGRQS
jgi:DNA-binding Xre family transcriptional regulator